MKQRVSVIIPAYNEERYLGATLDSIRKLRTVPDEIIVVDAESQDNTPVICSEYGVIHCTVEHRGIGFARQKGLEVATGDIIAYTDADTRVSPDWLDKILHALTYPEVVGVYGGYKVVDGVWWYRWFINYFYTPLMRISRLAGRDIPGGQNIAFLRDKAMKAGGFPVEFKSVEDFEMMRRLRTQGNVVFLTDNYVFSSGRRGNEGFLPVIKREFFGMMQYFFTGKADTFLFPDIR